MAQFSKFRDWELKVRRAHHKYEPRRMINAMSEITDAWQRIADEDGQNDYIAAVQRADAAEFRVRSAEIAVNAVRSQQSEARRIGVLIASGPALIMRLHTLFNRRHELYEAYDRLLEQQHRWQGFEATTELTELLLNGVNDQKAAVRGELMSYGLEVTSPTSSSGGIDGHHEPLPESAAARGSGRLANRKRTQDADPSLLAAGQVRHVKRQGKDGRSSMREADQGVATNAVNSAKRKRTSDTSPPSSNRPKRGKTGNDRNSVDDAVPVPDDDLPDYPDTPVVSSAAGGEPLSGPWKSRSSTRTVLAGAGNFPSQASIKQAAEDDQGPPGDWYNRNLLDARQDPRFGASDVGRVLVDLWNQHGNDPAFWADAGRVRDIIDGGAGTFDTDRQSSTVHTPRSSDEESSDAEEPNAFPPLLDYETDEEPNAFPPLFGYETDEEPYIPNPANRNTQARQPVPEPWVDGPQFKPLLPQQPDPPPQLSASAQQAKENGFGNPFPGSLDEWQWAATLGEGAYGHAGLWLLKDDAGNIIDRMAVKETYYQQAGDWTNEHYWTDLDLGIRQNREEDIHEMLSGLKDSDSIVRYRAGRLYEVFKMQRLYMEYCAFGSLWDVFAAHAQEYQESRLANDEVGIAASFIPEPFLWSILESLTESAHLMCKGTLASGPVRFNEILHRDIKPANIFLADNPGKAWPGMRAVAKLGDFGLAIERQTRRIANPQRMIIAGTEPYMAPEQFGEAQLIRRYELTSSTNVYAIGKTMLALVTLSMPGEHRHYRDLDVSDAVRDLYSVELINLIVECVQGRPASRPSVEELLEVVRSRTRERDARGYANGCMRAGPHDDSRVRLKPDIYTAFARPPSQSADVGAEF